MKKVSLLKSTIIIFFVGILTFSCSLNKSLSGKNGFSLKYELKKGDKFEVVTVSDASFEMDQMGTKVENLLKSKIEDIYTVLSSNKKTGLMLEKEFAGMSQELESQQGNASSDFTELIGKKVMLALSQNGKVDKCEGFDKLPEIKTVDGTVLNNKTYQRIAESSFFNMPEEPIEIGQLWSEEKSTDIPIGDKVLKSENITSYKIIEKTNIDGYDCLKIEVTGLNNVKGEFEQNGMALHLDRNTKSNGILYFSIKKGMFLSFENEAVGKGIIKVIDQDIDIPQNTRTKTKITVKFIN